MKMTKPSAQLTSLSKTVLNPKQLGNRAAEIGTGLRKAGQETLKAVSGWGQKIDEAFSQTPVGSKLKRLSQAEKKFLSNNLHLAKPFADAADKADVFATKFGEKNIIGKGKSIVSDGGGNAMRHAAWSALMVRSAYRNPIGGGDLKAAAIKAYEFGAAHENNPKNTIKVNSQMDFHNNSVGRNAAVRVLQANPKATEAEVLKAVAADFAKMKQVTADGKRLEGARKSDAPVSKTTR
jgi:hypothetical protein